MQVIYVPEGFEVNEGLRLTKEYKASSCYSNCISGTEAVSTFITTLFDWLQVLQQQRCCKCIAHGILPAG